LLLLLLLLWLFAVAVRAGSCGLGAHGQARLLLYREFLPGSIGRMLLGPPRFAELSTYVLGAMQLPGGAYPKLV